MALSAPPMTPAMATAPSGSAITRFEGSSVVAFAVQRGDAFAGVCRADDDLAAVELVGVEGVHGLRDFRHHEVGHVDDVVDRVQADGFQAILQPQGRRAGR